MDMSKVLSSMDTRELRMLVYSIVVASVIFLNFYFNNVPFFDTHGWYMVGLFCIVCSVMFFYMNQSISNIRNVCREYKVNPASFEEDGEWTKGYLKKGAERDAMNLTFCLLFMTAYSVISYFVDMRVIYFVGTISAYCLIQAVLLIIYYGKPARLLIGRMLIGRT